MNSIRATNLRRRPNSTDLPWWPDWVMRAKCREYDPEIFFELGPSGRDKDKILKAKKVCWKCPVSRLCLRENIAVPYGIFGGMTPGERLTLIGLKRGMTPYKTAYSAYVQLFSRYAE